MVKTTNLFLQCGATIRRELEKRLRLSHTAIYVDALYMLLLKSKKLTFWELTYWDVDILGIDISGVDILGVDILRLTPLNQRYGILCDKFLESCKRGLEAGN